VARKNAIQNLMYAAIPQQMKVRPAFTVEKLTGTRSHRVHIFDKEANRIKSKTIQEPAGYLVKFYKGHSIRCRDDAHLRMIGADMQLIPLVDDEGEVKGTMPNIDIPDDPDDRFDDDELVGAKEE
jgi:hypothetical protein